MNIIKPQLLKSGDTIGILATSGCIEDDTALNRGIDFFEKRGFKVKLSKNMRSADRYLAGTDQERIDAIHEMFADKSVNAIIALRGGYGAVRIVNQLNYELIRNNPKIFCGYSDITVLNAMILKRAGLATYSGPMLISDFGAENLNNYTSENFFRTLMTGKFNFDGHFWGGNLSSLVSLCGLDFIPDFKFNFFIEDINEPVYKIDKMLIQLSNIKQFRENVKSLYVGDFIGIDNEEWFNNLINEYARDLNIPIIWNFSASHSDKKLTIPYGC